MATLLNSRNWPREHQISGLDAVLLDLGTSIFQLREAERGFSFLADGPLDRHESGRRGSFGRRPGEYLSEAKLKDVFQTYGEERFAGRIARTLVESRRRQAFERTLQLAEAIEAGRAPTR